MQDGRTPYASRRCIALSPNPKSETNSNDEKKEIQNERPPPAPLASSFCIISRLNLLIVSDFEIRISDFGPIGSIWIKAPASRTHSRRFARLDYLSTYSAPRLQS